MLDRQIHIIKAKRCLPVIDKSFPTRAFPLMIQSSGIVLRSANRQANPNQRKKRNEEKAVDP
jgi:hypothetical protein